MVTRCPNQFDLIADITPRDEECLLKRIRTQSEHYGIVFCKNTLDSVGVHQFAVSQMTHDLPHRPAAREGDSIELFLIQPGYGPPKHFRPA